MKGEKKRVEASIAGKANARESSIGFSFFSCAALAPPRLTLAPLPESSSRFILSSVAKKRGGMRVG